jgi:hypothetical protein
MGHNFGLTHTDKTESYSSLITCTPYADPNSVMNSSVLNWTDFTPFDNIAVSTLYPKIAGTTKFYRYYDRNHDLYTTNA